MLVTPAVEPSEGMLNAMDEVNLDLMMCQGITLQELVAKSQKQRDEGDLREREASLMTGKCWNGCCIADTVPEESAVFGANEKVIGR